MSRESIQLRRDAIYLSRPDDVIRDYDVMLAVVDAAVTLEASHPCQHDGVEDASDCPILALRTALAALKEGA